jgi:transposase-like protein
MGKRHLREERLSLARKIASGEIEASQVITNCGIKPSTLEHWDRELRRSGDQSPQFSRIVVEQKSELITSVELCIGSCIVKFNKPPEPLYLASLLRELRT